MTLVDQLRRMVGASKTQYTAGEHIFWTDEDLEGVLKQHVVARLLQAEVSLIPTVAPNSGFIWLNGKVDFQGTLDTETAALVTFTGQEITGATIHDDGRIEFASDVARAVPLLSGLAFDLNAAAADVLTDWASAVKLGYDISTDGQSMKRSQRHEQLLEQAKTYRARAVIGSVNLSRTDTRARMAGLPSAVLQSFERWGLWA